MKSVLIGMSGMCSILFRCTGAEACPTVSISHYIEWGSRGTVSDSLEDLDNRTAGDPQAMNLTTINYACADEHKRPQI